MRTMKKVRIVTLHILAYLWILSMVCAMGGCSMLSAAGGAAGGAAIGSLGGPGGAALGGAAGSLTGHIVADSMAEPTAQPVVLPSGEVVMPQPETAWGLLGKLLDVAPGLIILGIILWLISLFAPSPVSSFRKFLSNVRRKSQASGKS